MADENENEFEEEFDFESDESLLEESSPDIEALTGAPKKMPLPIMIGGAVVGLIILFVIFRLFFAGEKEELAPPPPVVEAPPPAPTAPVVQAPPPPEPDLWAGVTGPEETGEPKITPATVVEKIEAQQQMVKKDIQNLERKLNELLSRLSTLDQSVSSSNRDLTQLSIKLEAINQELKMMAAPPVEKEGKIKETAPAYVAPTLDVHAIIPGRAWLKTKDGRTLTVTEGDPVEGYGKVIVIDAPSGIVITSSGVVLRQ